MDRRQFQPCVHYDFDNDKDIPFRSDGNDSRICPQVEFVKGCGKFSRHREAIRKHIPLGDATEGDESVKKRIRREATILHRARHDHVVQLIMTYFYKMNFVIIMDRASQNLQHYLDRDAENIRDGWFGCLISVVSHIHQLGIRHRDIKPQNILIKGDQILLADFGISYMFSGKTITTANHGQGRARTVAYCAPEVECEGATPGRSADIFSLGAVFLEMLLARYHPDLFRQLQNEVLDSGPQNLNRSYALNIDKVHSWMDAKRAIFGKPHYDWKSTMFSLCQKMLFREKTQRPKATELRLWWMRCSSLFSWRECRCLPRLREPEYFHVEKINERLLEAYQKGHRIMVEFWKTKGALINTSISLVAASRGRLWDVVSELVTNEVKVDARDSAGRTTLHFVAGAGELELAMGLLNHGADFEAKDNSQRTALQLAASNACIDMIWLLLQSKFQQDEPFFVGEEDIGEMKRADLIEFLYEKMTGAPATYRREITQGLVEKGPGFDDNEACNDADSIVDVPYKEEALLQLLLDQRAGVTCQKDSQAKQSMLLTAATQGHEAVVRLLLDADVNMEGGEEEQGTPLLRAAKYGHWRIVKRMLDKMDMIKAKDPLADTPPPGTQIMEAKDSSDQTPLSIAVQGGHKEVVELLLNHGADVEVEDCLGETPLSKAAERGYTILVEYLIDSGAIVDASDKNRRTPLMKAAAGGHRDTVEALVQRGADINARDTEGQTPIVHAYNEGNREIVKLLVLVKVRKIWESHFPRYLLLLLGLCFAASLLPWKFRETVVTEILSFGSSIHLFGGLLRFDRGRL